jgi:hypothetical protein
MTRKQLHTKALHEWHNVPEVRLQYRTLDHYWREKYDRVYCAGFRSRLSVGVLASIGCIMDSSMLRRFC